MEKKWDRLHLDFLLTLRAKGMPFASISETLRRYAKVNATEDELRAVWYDLLTTDRLCDSRPNNCMDGYDWSALEIKRLKVMRRHGVSLLRARQILCRSASQIKKQWKLINRPII